MPRIDLAGGGGYDDPQMGGNLYEQGGIAGPASNDTPTYGTPSYPDQPPAPKPSTPSYNTTPQWQDSLNPPSPGDPYWADWAKANPTYPGAQSAATSPAFNGDYRGYFDSLFPGAWGQAGTLSPQQLVSREGDLNKIGVKVLRNAKGIAGKIQLPNGDIIDAIQGSESGYNGKQWLTAQEAAANNAMSAQQAPAVGQNGNVFTDPATAEWESLVRSLTDRFNQPTQNPDMNPLLDYMRQYFAQLQQPVYTDAQRDLINTQTLDPMERQRQARKQQVTQQLAARGISPESGPAIQALQDVDREFDTMRTQAQGQFTTNEIAQGKQNQAQALQVGTSLANLQNQTFANNEARALQGLDIFGKIPALADSRMAAANGVLNANSVNPAQLLNSFANFSQIGNSATQYQSAQDQQFWSQIGAALAKLFGH